jgi:hypothetical protein
VFSLSDVLGVVIESKVWHGERTNFVGTTSTDLVSFSFHRLERAGGLRNPLEEWAVGQRESPRERISAEIHPH